jgi:hypothetical protein
MDGQGGYIDNIFVEWPWRFVKYEEIYLHDYETVSDARKELFKYCFFYNMERLHEPLGYKTPYEIYVKELLNINPVFCRDNGESFRHRMCSCRCAIISNAAYRMLMAGTVIVIKGFIANSL